MFKKIKLAFNRIVLGKIPFEPNYTPFVMIPPKEWERITSEEWYQDQYYNKATGESGAEAYRKMMRATQSKEVSSQTSSM